MIDRTQSPAWRWELGVHSAKQDALHNAEDSAICAVVRFVHQLHHCTTERDGQTLAKRFPNLFGAYSIFHKEGTTRYTLEARVLADEARELIAKKTGYCQNIIQTYEHFFFDVRSRLTEIDFIMNRAIGLNFDACPPEDQLFSLWKLLAYIGGIHTFERIVGLGLDIPRELPPFKLMDF